jgi:hypothetical protein
MRNRKNSKKTLRKNSLRRKNTRKTMRNKRKYTKGNKNSLRQKKTRKTQIKRKIKTLRRYKKKNKLSGGALKSRIEVMAEQEAAYAEAALGREGDESFGDEWVKKRETGDQADVAKVQLAEAEQARRYHEKEREEEATKSRLAALAAEHNRVATEEAVHNMGQLRAVNYGPTSQKRTQEKKDEARIEKEGREATEWKKKDDAQQEAARLLDREKTELEDRAVKAEHEVTTLKVQLGELETGVNVLEQENKSLKAQLGSVATPVAPAVSVLSASEAKEVKRNFEIAKEGAIVAGDNYGTDSDEYTAKKEELIALGTKLGYGKDGLPGGSGHLRKLESKLRSSKAARFLQRRRPESTSDTGPPHGTLMSSA